jgi:flagellar motor component MotA
MKTKTAILFVATLVFGIVLGYQLATPTGSESSSQQHQTSTLGKDLALAGVHGFFSGLGRAVGSAGLIAV